MPTTTLTTPAAAGVRPLMYGYVRVDLAEWDGQVAQWDAEIEAFAHGEGFDLGTVFHDNSKRGAFITLLAELQRSECRHVVVVSMSHVYNPGRCPQALVARLRDEAGAGVWVSVMAANQIEVRAHDRRVSRGLDGAT